jgi:hypothetical protein
MIGGLSLKLGLKLGVVWGIPSNFPISNHNGSRFLIDNSLRNNDRSQFDDSFRHDDSQLVVQVLYSSNSQTA